MMMKTVIRCIGMLGGNYAILSGGGMGFRDFHSFNLAMLAKQSWRLINEPDSLCARVLRAKYYPDGDILKAGPKAGSSFTWTEYSCWDSNFQKGNHLKSG
jgi:hypothetical protein